MVGLLDVVVAAKFACARERDRGIEESDCMGLMREDRELNCLYYLML